MGADLKLAQCRKCQAFTLLGDVGVLVAVDVSPLDAKGYAQALFSTADLWWVENTTGRGQKLRGALEPGAGPTFDPKGAQNGAQRLHAEHPCSAKLQEAVKPPPGPREAPVTPGNGKGGLPLPPAPVAGAPGPSPARRATHLLSRPPRCGTCRKVITPGQEFWGIQHGHIWKMAEHESCE
jgi:hypothetical protein